MHTLGMFAYLVATLILASLLTVVVSMFRNIKSHDDFRSWRYILFFWVILSFGPYLYADLLTRKSGTDFEKIVRKTMSEAEVGGKMEYFRVLTLTDRSARIVAVATEPSSIGFMDRVVMTIDLSYSGKKWEAKQYQFVSSFKRGKDAVSMPPYW
ncbi:MAG: hypothetical protein MUC92_02575 [Fimbriimonadaceae bacterium]|nr:hypothetical protein [Fimbriimonadaceae bacterium]